MTTPAVPSAMTIRVRDMPLLADIGINPEEIGRLQPLVVSVELDLASLPVSLIDDTIDYRRILAAAEALAGERIPLIESFAQQLGAECLSWPRVRRVRVSIDKPFALARGLAGVEIEMA